MVLFVLLSVPILEIFLEIKFHCSIKTLLFFFVMNFFMKRGKNKNKIYTATKILFGILISYLIEII